MPVTIDLNADLGEGFGAWQLGDDDALLAVVTSANVACGFHAGDPAIMARVCQLAASRGVAIGAQVGYRDLVGFGRRDIAVPAAELAADVAYQLGALDAFCRLAGTRVRYVKPHGALYHRLAVDNAAAAAVVAAVARFDPALAVLGLPGSRLLDRAAEAGLAAIPEGFADRAYLGGGGLVPRDVPGAVIDDEATVVARAVQLATSGTVVAIDGGEVGVAPQSLCLHSDTPGAARLARAVRAALTDAGVAVQAFA
ncbi:MAG: LamB/YcsF family protein [Sporichthyaceae bacterium]|nr:LamB/YcsF family protein [Sporichthyaceae bacterium]